MRRSSLLGCALGAAIVLAMVTASVAAGATSWHPNAKGGLDCNGFSPVQKTFRYMICTEIAANSDEGFLDNGHYVGHDGPTSASSRTGTARPTA
jgi:hypothetical protein